MKYRSSFFLSLFYNISDEKPFNNNKSKYGLFYVLIW